MDNICMFIDITRGYTRGYLLSRAVGIIVNTSFLVKSWTLTPLERPYMANIRLGNYLQ